MTYEKAKEKWEMYSKAENAIVSGAQSYEIDGRQMTKADLGTIGERMDYWESKMNSYKKPKQVREVRTRGGL